jgi:probable O-glycosylation ligase (exosortase A-associated)
LTHTIATQAPAPSGTPTVREQPLSRRKSVVIKPRVWTIGTISVCLYLFVVHSYKINLGSAAVLIGLFGVLITERPIRITVPMILYAVYLLWNLLLLPISIAPFLSPDKWMDAAKIFLIMVLVYNAMRNREQHRLITLAWLGMFAFFPVRGTLFNFLTGQGEFGRYAWNFQFGNFNDMAALTLIPLAMSVERLRSTDKKWVKLCALAGLFVLPFIILITGSRGGLLGMGVMLTYLLVRSRFRTRIAMAIVPIALIAMLFAPQNVWDRIRSMANLTSVESVENADTSAQQRFLIWQVAAGVIQRNPITGVGFGAYPIAHGRSARGNTDFSFARGLRDAHSTYLTVLAETGIVGFVLFMMIFITASYELFKTSRSLKNRTSPIDVQLRDRCQAYQSALLGLSVCAIFGSLQEIVFPFMFIALAAAAVRCTGSDAEPAPAVTRRRRPLVQRNVRPQPTLPASVPGT